jgi:hypothetical protein
MSDQLDLKVLDTRYLEQYSIKLYPLEKENEKDEDKHNDGKWMSRVGIIG